MALTKVQSGLLDGGLNLSASAPDNTLVTTSAGNVGIGTATPATVGGTALVVNHATTPRIRLTNNTTGQAGSDGAELSLFGSDFNIENREAANIVFYNSGAERMRIDSSGNLLVGTVATGVGSARIYSVNGTGANNAAIFATGTGTAASTAVCRIYHVAASGATSATMVDFVNVDGNVRGTITTSGSATAYNTSSDYRLKENIAPMTDALATVQALKPVTYTWKVDGSDGQGFIAHELAEVCPDAVTGEKDAVDSEGNIKPQGIDTSFLVATLTAAIQEQQAIITDLKARIETLEAK